MSTMHQHARDRSRQRSYDSHVDSTSEKEDATFNAAGTKRLFSNRMSRISVSSQDYAEKQFDPPAERHSEKRHRASDWPLTNKSPPSHASTRAPLRHRNAPNSPPTRRSASVSSQRPSSQIRPSKFVEGSMNDRVSQMPPPTYLYQEEELLDKYDADNLGGNKGRKMAQPRKFTRHANASMVESSATERSESRHSSIFKFGKSIAASFNPTNWKIFSKQAEAPEDEEAQQQRILRERQEKAQRIYQDLKEAGHFRDSANTHQLYQGLVEQKSIAATKHDSGVSFIDESPRKSRASTEISRDEKRKGRVYLEPPKFSNNSRAGSPASNCASVVSTPNKQGFNFRKPSLINIRKSFSNDYASETRSGGDHHARRIPSRKDLQKQQKLVKRVSNLEGKLEAARRQLEESLQEAVPSQVHPRAERSRFVPGALATLPSERLLSGYLSSEAGQSENGSYNEIGKAVSMDQNRTPLKGISQYHEQRSEPTMFKADPSSTRAGKQLPQTSSAPENHASQIVENRQSLMVKLNVKHKPAKANFENPDINSSQSPAESGTHYVRQEEEEEEAIKSKDNQQPKKPAPRKRKSLPLEGLADDGGNYRPGAESDSESIITEVKKTTPRKKPAAGPPRKARKPIRNSPPKLSFPRSNDASKAHLEAPPAKSVKTNQGDSPSNNAAPTGPRNQSGRVARAPSTAASSRSVKSRIPQTQRGRQSVSPPPSSAFTGLEYTKPARTARTEQQHIPDTADSRHVEGEDEVPPTR